MPRFSMLASRNSMGSLLYKMLGTNLNQRLSKEKASKIDQSNLKSRIIPFRQSRPSLDCLQHNLCSGSSLKSREQLLNKGAAIAMKRYVGNLSTEKLESSGRDTSRRHQKTRPRHLTVSHRRRRIERSKSKRKSLSVPRPSPKLDFKCKREGGIS